MSAVSARFNDLLGAEGFSFADAQSRDDYNFPQPARLLDEEGEKLCSLTPEFVDALSTLGLPDKFVLALLKQVHSAAYGARAEGLRIGRVEGRRAIVGVVHELLGINQITEALADVSVRIQDAGGLS